MAVAVVGNRELVAALLASSLFESAQALVTLAVRPADRSTAARRLALRTAHAPRPSPAHHALLPFLAPHLRATLCRNKGLRVYTVGASSEIILLSGICTFSIGRSILQFGSIRISAGQD